MTQDKSHFLLSFRTEAETYLATLNSGLVKLEKDPSDYQLLSELFRAAHTLKGVSKMMNFAQICQVAHKLEDLFGLLKEKKLEFKPSVADSVFHVLDDIKRAVETVSTGGKEDLAVEALCDILESVLNGVPVHIEKAPAPAPPLVPVPFPAKEERSAPEEEFLRIPSGRINQLLNLIGEMLSGKVKSGSRVPLIKKIARQAHQSERTMFELETKIKETFGISDDLIVAKGVVIRASPREQKGVELLNKLHHAESMLASMKKEIVGLGEGVQSEYFHLAPILDELQQKMKEIRMLPCSVVFEGFPRLVRDIARDQNKQVELIIEGQRTELDKAMLDAIKGPLVHILRNSVDHGIEAPEERKKAGKPAEATVRLSAYQEGDQVIITVSDDGKGIDVEKLKAVALKNQTIAESRLQTMSDREATELVFLEGMSTAPIITDVSGRGIGLNVVKTEIERLKGFVAITSKRGVGTTMKISLPLTVAILRVLLIECGDMRWALPVQNLVESLRVRKSEIPTINNQMRMQIRGESIPAISLLDVLNLQGREETSPLGPGNATKARADGDHSVMLIVNSRQKRIGFFIDRVLGEEEVFIKTLGPHLGKVTAVGGAAVLASGEIVVVLDPHDLIALAETMESGSAKKDKKKSAKARHKVLIVEDSLTTRELVKTILDNSGYDVETSIDGMDAMEKLATKRFDAVISDIEMPRMGGFELCRNIRSSEKLRNMPVIFLTSLSQDEEKRKGIELGAQAYLTKNSFDQRTLLDIIGRVL